MREQFLKRFFFRKQPLVTTVTTPTILCAKVLVHPNGIHPPQDEDLLWHRGGKKGARETSSLAVRTVRRTIDAAREREPKLYNLREVRSHLRIVRDSCTVSPTVLNDFSSTRLAPM